MGYNSQTDIMNQVYLKQAYIYASNSIDPSTQNGAVLLHPLRGIVLGACNELPERIKETPDRWKRPEKYCYVEHAERNAIYRCALKGFSTAGLYMYCPWWCCAECARGIVQSGISKFVGHHLMYELATNRWKESIDRGLELMTAAGIDVVNWDGRIERKDIKVVFDGETIIP